MLKKTSRSTTGSGGDVVIEQAGGSTGNPYIKPRLTELTVDFSSEGLNNMARKINEIVIHLNAL